MMKKLLSFLLIAVIMVSCLPSVLAVSDLEPDAPYINAVDAVTALGIMESESDTSFNPKKTVTRAEFVAYAVHLMNINSQTAEDLFYDVPVNHKYAKEITYAYKSGMVHGDGMGHFYPDSSVSLSEAVKILCFVTGHNRIAAQFDNPEIKYNMLADELDLTDGLNLSKSDKLTRGETAQILYNVLFAPVVQADYTNGYSNLYENNDVTVMSNYLDIDFVEGRMTANRYTSLTGNKKSSASQIEIEFEAYSADNDIDDGLLGYSVTAFYREANNRKEIVYLMPSDDDNTITEISAKDIVKSENGKLEYTYGKKTKTVKIPSDVYLIYNGDILLDWYMSDLSIANGSLKLISNDGDDNIDVVIAENYTNDMLVGVSEDSEKLYFKTLGVLAYDSYATENNLIIKDAVSGGTLSVGNLKADTMVSVLKSKDGKRCTLYANSSSVNGILNSVSDDTATIGGAEYPIYADVDFSPYLGKNITVWVDYNGYLAIIDDKTNSEQLGYILGVDLSHNAIDKKAMVKMFSDDSTTSVFYVSDNVTVDGKRTAVISGSAVTITAENFKTVLENAAVTAGNKDGNASQLVRYRVGESGEITSIDTANYTDDEVDSSLRLSTLVTQTSGDKLYCRGGGVLYNMGKRRVACNIPSTAKVFLIPTGPEYRLDSDELSVENGNYFKADSYYVNGSSPTGVAFEAYNCNDVRTSEVIVLYMPDDSMIGSASTSISSNYGTRAFAIKNIYRALDDDGSEVSMLVTFDANGNEIEYQTSRKLTADYISANFKIGDTVAVNLVNNKITAIKQLFRYSSDASYLTPNLTDQDVVFYGELYSCDGSYMALNFAASDATPDTSSFYVGRSDQTRFMIYDTAGGKLRTAKVGDFIGSKQTGSAGNKVLIYTNWSSPRLVVMFE